ncbi:Protein FLOWERING LOCUS T [Capsicum annuum]|nr:Protein FLOWERING LOCUS T [Capsicum annuum]
MVRVREPLVVGRVIGDVLDHFTKSVELKVSYIRDQEVYNGCQLKPSQVINQPRVNVGGNDLRTFYTLVSSILFYQTLFLSRNFFGNSLSIIQRVKWNKKL